MTSEGSICYRKFQDLQRRERQHGSKVQEELKEGGVIEAEEGISGVFEEVSFIDTIGELTTIVDANLEEGNDVVKVCSLDMYEVIKDYEEDMCASNEGPEVQVETKYKIVAKKVKPIALPLPSDSMEKMDRASRQPYLREPKNIGHTFTPKSLEELKIGCESFLTQEKEKCFKEMLSKHGKAFAFQPHEIGCVNPSIVAPMVIFTVPHVPWNLRPIPVPKAHLSC